MRLFEYAINIEPKNVGRIDFFSFYFLILFVQGLFGGVLYSLFPYIAINYIGIPFMIAGGFYFAFFFVTNILLVLMIRKRFVDAGFSFFNILWLLFPFVGFFIFFYIMIQPSKYISPGDI